MAVQTYELRRLISKEDLEGNIYENLTEIRNRLTKLSEEKEDELNRTSTNGSNYMEAKIAIKKKSLSRLNYYISVFSDENIKALVEEETTGSKTQTGRDLYLKAMSHKGNKKSAAIKEFRRAMLFGISRAEQQLIEMYSQSDLQEHHDLIKIIQARPYIDYYK